LTTFSVDPEYQILSKFIGSSGNETRGEMGRSSQLSCVHSMHFVQIAHSNLQ